MPAGDGCFVAPVTGSDFVRMQGPKPPFSWAAARPCARS